MSQKLRGLVAQGMDGRKKQFRAYAAAYPPGSYTWTSPASGYYVLTNWGGGDSGGGGNPGASGSFTQSIAFFAKGEQVAVVVGTTAVASTFSFRGRTITAGAAAANVAGVATGGDFNINGSVGGLGVPGSNGLGGNGGTAAVGATGGAGAPGRGAYRGSAGGSTGPAAGGSDGAGFGAGYAIISRQDTSILN